MIQQGAARPPRWWQHLARDPITHFTIAGAILFALNAAIAGDERPVIRINPGAIEAALRERASLTDRPQTNADRHDIVDTLTAEEILLREAYRRGYDKTSRIRAQLIQTMRLALSDEPGPPDEPTLRAYFDANRARFLRPTALSLTQIILRDGIAPPGSQPEAPATDPSGALRIRNATREDLIRQYGTAMAASVTAIQDQAWHGPLHGAGRAYYIRVDAHHPSRTPEFEEVARVIAGEWALARQQDAIRQRVAEIGRAYRVLAPPDP